MRSFAFALLVLPAVAYGGGIVFGGTDTVKQCRKALTHGIVKNNVPDPDSCSQ